MKKSIKDKIKNITDNSASKSYVTMEQLKLSLKNNGLISGGAYEDHMTKGCAEIIEKDYPATLIDILNRIDKLNIRLSDQDITYLIDTFNTFSNCSGILNL